MSVLSAQEVRGTFTGTVADPQGAIIVGAKVVARNLAIGSVTESVTNGTGLFVAPLLAMGKYQITASNGQVIDSARVKDLPLLGRNPFLLAAISTAFSTAPPAASRNLPLPSG